MEKFPSTQKEDWMCQLQKTATKRLEMLSHPPAELDPNGKLSAAADREDKNPCRNGDE
jgi:hypothetical protein